MSAIDLRVKEPEPAVSAFNCQHRVQISMTLFPFDGDGLIERHQESERISAPTGCRRSELHLFSVCDLGRTRCDAIQRLRNRPSFGHDWRPTNIESPGARNLVSVQVSGNEVLRLARLQVFLEQDPDNLNLIADAANAALDESDLLAAEALLDRYRAIAPLTPPLLNVDGVVAMRQGRLADAESAFTALLAAGHDNPAVRFNLAWGYALAGRHEAVLPLLDDAVVAAVPRAAALKVQTLHHLGMIEDALAVGQVMVGSGIADNALLGALSVAAMDNDDIDLARDYADRSTGGADALTTQGLLLLESDAAADSLSLFERALAEHADAPRAWIGQGLGLLALGDAAGAAQSIDRGAEIFGTHLGSWIAAGWAHFAAGDAVTSRARFETARSIDANFAESHGALAVLDITEGNLAGAREKADIARRLDRDSFGGILARTLLLQGDGNAARADKIRDHAMHLPIGVDGKTLAQAMLGVSRHPRNKAGR